MSENDKLKDLNEDIKILNDQIQKILVEKRKMEEEKNKEIKKLLSIVEEQKQIITQYELKGVINKQLMPINEEDNKKTDIENVQSFVSDLVRVISEYKTTLNSVSTNQDVFLKNTFVARLLFNLQHQNTEIISVLNDKKFLEKLNHYEEEIALNKKEIEFLNDSLNKQKSLVNDYKEKLNVAFKKMKDIMDFAQEKKESEANLKRQLEAKTEEHKQELSALKNNYDEAYKNKNQYQNILTIVQAYLLNILSTNRKKINIEILTRDIKDSLDKVQYQYDYKTKLIDYINRYLTALLEKKSLDIEWNFPNDTKTKDTLEDLKKHFQSKKK